MNGFLTVEEVANSWKISQRRVQVLCREGRVSGAEKRGGIWFIPISEATKEFKIIIFVFRLRRNGSGI